MDETTQRDQIFKQRRLLYTFTFILAAVHGAAVVPGDSAQVQGLILQIKRPEVLLIGLWIAWAYAYYRYWLYYRMVPHAQLRGELAKLEAKHALRFISPHVRFDVIKGNLGKTIANRDSFTVTKQKGSRIEEKQDRSGGTVTGLLLQSIDPVTRNRVGTVEEIKPYDISATGVKTARRQARLEFMATHPYWTDYVVPLWVGALAPVAGGFSLVMKLI